MKLKVLVADDSKVAQIMIGEGLSDDLYSKRTAVNGQEALDIYYKWQPDIVLLDIMMPLVSGYLVLKEIREYEKKEGTPKKTGVVMLTALSDKESITDCLRIGVQGYVVKPFKPGEIAQRVEEARTKMEAAAKPTEQK